ncbi:energy transducer TonB [Echinimonas agarilytica]|uniref:Protein TonB n=1 Tax=Echinimonas agarilytica TaxID=1215918 RepID=A0AA42B816_9GAMM|nr:energy transducer TonB [Echinimonas agarilytica]MCM2679826.1 energy transducer TonB [Echinimonas agarilytica]
MLRLLISILLGIAVTFGLFVFMAELIANSGRPPEEPSPPVVIDLVVKANEAKPNVRKTPPPPPPPPPTPPKTPPVEPEPVVSDAPSISLTAPVIETGGTSGFSGPAAINRDGDAQPIVRIEPKYPIKAARDGKEGYVIMRFTINELGGVDDIEVIEAQPKRVFDKEAKRALRKWKYKPKVVEGKAMKQFGLTVRLDFSLEK